MLHADLITDLPHIFQRSGSEVELLSGVRMNRVNHQMGVKMLPIHMGGHQDLTAREELLRQFQPDLMGLGRSKDLFWGKKDWVYW